MRSLQSIAYIDHGRVNKDRRNPLPFPGRYPTRWKIVIHEPVNPLECIGETKKTRYIGKPSLRMGLKFLKKMAMIPNGAYWFCEFDRGGVISRAGGPTGHGRFPLQEYNGTLIGFYYPWSVVNEVCGPWRIQFLYPIRIHYKGQQSTLYSPYDNMLDEAAHGDKLGDFRQWLGNAQIKF